MRQSGVHQGSPPVMHRAVHVTAAVDTAGATTGATADLLPVRINSDEIDDLLVFETQESGLIQGLLLLSITKSQ